MIGRYVGRQVGRYEGDPRSNANISVISSTFGISIVGLYV